MPNSHDSLSRRFWIAALVVPGLISALALIDIIADLREGAKAGHVLSETAIVILAAAAVFVAGRRLVGELRRSRTSADKLARELSASSEAAAEWRGRARTLIEGLGRAIDVQFEAWQLSPAEKEVGLLLLKGLSHKEIASMRSVTEATARQQARSMYKKAGLSGRHDLAAFFLEDLMLPDAQPQFADSAVH